MRDGSDPAAMPVSCRRGRLSAKAKNDWIHSDLRMQTSALRFTTRQLPERCCAEASRDDLRTSPAPGNAPRVHYPTLRNGDSLFPEFDLPDFTVIGHRGYSRVLRELRALQNRLYDCTKFDNLIRYRCANLSFLVLPHGSLPRRRDPGRLGRACGIGWRAHAPAQTRLAGNAPENRLRLLQRIAMAGTRAFNRQLEIERSADVRESPDGAMLHAPARANSARSFPLAAAIRARIRASARCRPGFRPRTRNFPASLAT